MSDLIERIDALERLIGSPGWAEMFASVSHRRALLAAQIVQEKPDRERDVIAAQIRELDAVLAWPAKTIQSLTDQRERNEQGADDGEG